MPRSVLIALLRNDLRLTDNALLAHLPKDVTHFLPLYVFDQRQIELSGLPDFPSTKPAKTAVCGFWRTGPYRLRYLVEAVYDLQSRLRGIGSDLVIRYGLPDVVADRIAGALRDQGDHVRAVWMTSEPCVEEQRTEEKLREALSKRDIELKLFDTKTAVHRDDLPFPIKDVPDVYTDFRKRVEGLREKMWRQPLKAPTKLPPCPDVPAAADIYRGGDAFSMQQTLEALLKPIVGDYDCAADGAYDERSAHPFKGGETAALERLNYYFFDSSHGKPPAATYKTTRNGMLGERYSTKFSSMVAIGTLSPRTILAALEEHDSKFGGSQDSYWIQFELLWRDFFQFTARKFGTSLFLLEGFEAQTNPRSAHEHAQRWKWYTDEQGRKSNNAVAWLEGKTGVPLIDANMVELRKTGFVSNRGRQNVASFLTKDLGLDWRIGAEFYESLLLDYDPASNYGNWQYQAGVGNDPRSSRQFNPIKQGKDYDAEGEYLATWLPQLKPLSAERRHVPWLLNGFDAPADYPTRPIVEQNSWKSHYTRKAGGKDGPRGGGRGGKNRGRGGRGRGRGLGPKTQRAE